MARAVQTPKFAAVFLECGESAPGLAARFSRAGGTTLTPLGGIMIAAVVLETHMLMKAVAARKPPTRREGLLPTWETTKRAIRVCRPQCSRAWPRSMPPRKRKMTSLAYGAAADLMSITPRNGKR